MFLSVNFVSKMELLQKVPEFLDSPSCTPSWPTSLMYHTVHPALMLRRDVDSDDELASLFLRHRCMRNVMHLLP